MDDLTKHFSDDNMGGLEKIWFIPIDDVDTISNEFVGQLKTITLNSGKRWYECYFSPEDSEVASGQEDTPDGILVKNAINGFIPGDSQELVLLLNEMSRTRFLVVTRDQNGEYSLHGTTGTPLRFTSSYTSGKATGDRRGHRFSFSSNQLYLSGVLSSFNPTP